MLLERFGEMGGHAINVLDLPKFQRLYQSRESLGLRELDFQFARFIVQQERQWRGLQVSDLQQDDIRKDDIKKWDWLAILACVLSFELSKGNVCLQLSAQNADKNDKPSEKIIATHPFLKIASEDDPLQWIEQFEVIASVDSSLEVTQGDVDEGGHFNLAEHRKPLIFDHGRIYLQRYWHYEVRLYLAIETRLRSLPWQSNTAALSHARQSLIQLFQLKPSSAQSQKKDEMDWQAVAAFIASQKQFSVISGGPGTGKTTTVIRLLAVIVGLFSQQFNRAPMIKLAAPTGKAAMRLSESIKGAKQKLDVAADIKSAIPEEASTLHRLLKQGRNGEFQHGRFDPLHLDVLIVDEASMVDLPLMSKLMDALPQDAQIILLGDRDQLASVEAGSVLGDICDSGHQHGYSPQLCEQIESLSSAVLPDGFQQASGALIRDHLCQLQKSYRFHENSGIGHLARAANQGAFNQWERVLERGYSDIQVWPSSINTLMDEFTRQVTLAYQPYLERCQSQPAHSETSALAVHQAFNEFQVLCALRQGDAGVAGLNQVIETALSKKGFISKSTSLSKGYPTSSDQDEHSAWYAGRPVMIMENDYALNLFNGDIGIALWVAAEEGGARTEPVLKVSFVTADGQVRWVKPSRLPKHETVYAMTIHKSQGSEFNHCLMVLPDVMVDVLNKELIYTGITRAKSQFTLFAQPTIVRRALQRRVQRASGLRQRLWQTRAVEPSSNNQADSSPSQKPPSDSGEQLRLF